MTETINVIKKQSDSIKLILKDYSLEEIFVKVYMKLFLNYIHFIPFESNFLKVYQYYLGILLRVLYIFQKYRGSCMKFSW